MSDNDEQEWHNGQAHMEVATDVGYFRNFLDGMEAVTDEGKLVITEDKMFTKVVDPSNVMMGVARIKGQALNGIIVEGKDQVLLGAEFNEMNNLLSNTSKNSELDLSYPHVKEGSNNVRLQIIDEDIEFFKPAIDPNAVPEIPQNDPLSHKTRVVLSGSDLKSAIGHAEKTMDPEAGSVVFRTESDKLKIESSDKVNGSFSKTFHQSGPSTGDGLGEHKTEISFSYLDSIKTVLGSSDEVTLHIKEENPLRIDVDLDEAGDAQIIYIIAPRLGN